MEQTIRWANHGQKVHRPSPTVITLKNLSIFSIFGLSGFTKQVCEPVKKMRAKKVNKSCDIEENKHLKKSFCKDIKTMDSNNKRKSLNDED